MLLDHRTDFGTLHADILGKTMIQAEKGHIATRWDSYKKSKRMIRVTVSLAQPDRNPDKQFQQFKH